jgi:hypothetical protein
MTEILPGLVFGLVDNGVLIFGALTGLEIERFFTKGSGALGAVWGGGIGNTISDLMGSLLDPTMHDMVLGIFVGCLFPLLLIPFLKRFIR